MKIRVIVTAFVAMGLITSTVSGELVALLGFDGCSTLNEYVADDLGLFNIEFHGNPNFTEGKFGQALYCDGFGDYLFVTNSSKIDTNNHVTVAAWVQIDPRSDSSMPIITKGLGSWRLNLDREKGKSLVSFYCTGVKFTGRFTRDHAWGRVRGETLVNDGNWYHVTGTYDGSYASLYINGKLETRMSASGSINKNDAPIAIGGNVHSQSTCFDGLIDEVALFDHGLTSQEVRLLYEKGAKSFTSKDSLDLSDLWRDYLYLQKRDHIKAVEVLEAGIVACEEMITRNNNLSRHEARISTRMYSELARAEAARRATPEHLTALYKKTVQVPIYEDGYITSIDWLFKHLSIGEFREVITGSFKTSKSRYDIPLIVQHLYGRQCTEIIEAYLDSIIAANPNKDTGVAMIYTMVEKNETWQKHFGQYCKARPDLIEPMIRKLVNKAQAYEAKLQYEFAQKLYDRSIDMCASQSWNEVDSDFMRAEILYSSGNYIDSLRAWEDFITKYGDSQDSVVDKKRILEAWVYNGKTCIYLKKMEKAYQAFQMAADYDPINPAVIFYKGYIHMLQGGKQKSEELFSSLIEQHPDTAYAGKARLCLQKLDLNNRTH